MKVKDLIEFLKQQNPEHAVVLSKDAEGNEYSPLSELIAEVEYVPDNNWSGEVNYITDDSDFETNALVFYPLN